MRNTQKICCNEMYQYVLRFPKTSITIFFWGGSSFKCIILDKNSLSQLHAKYKLFSFIVEFIGVPLFMWEVKID